MRDATIIQRLQVVSADSVYSPNNIISLTTGGPTWVSADAADGIAGGVTGSQVIFTMDHLVLAQPYVGP